MLELMVWPVAGGQMGLLIELGSMRWEFRWCL